MFGLFRKKTPFQKTIKHEDWLLIGGEAAVFIPKEEYKRKKPFVTIEAPPFTVGYQKLNHGILITRGLPIYKGAPFVTKVTIT